MRISTDVYGENFADEILRVLKKKVLKRYGEYRMKRLVLEAYGGLESLIR